MAARLKLHTLSLHKIIITARLLALTLRYADGRLAMMKSMLACAILLALPLSRAAEVPVYDYRQPLHNGAVVGIECHKKKGTLEVGIYTQADGRLKRMDLWRVEDLIRMDGETFQVQGVRQVERNCEIGTDRYRVRFVGLPGAANANWLCGALMSASVTVWKNGRQVLDRDFDDNPCRPHIEGIQRAVFRRGQPMPEITAAPR
jgi:hypothetical protein